MCLKESLIPVYIEANIADNVNIRNADTGTFIYLTNLLCNVNNVYKHAYISTKLSHFPFQFSEELKQLLFTLRFAYTDIPSSCI